jgi:alcohol dehydrogenase class IV
MVATFTFAPIPEIHFGQGKIRDAVEVMKRYGKSVAVVTGKSSFTDSPAGQSFFSLLKTEKIKYSVINVSGEPSINSIDAFVEQYRGTLPSVIISIGGGSVIDTGKAISAMLKEKGSVADFLEGSDSGRKHNGMKVPFIAVPTTAGTGSETTKNAVLSKVGEDGFKRSLRHDNFIPDVAIIDPELTLNCPSEVTAASGLDAFTQLFEAYISTASSPLTDALAYDGILNVVKYLITAYHDGNNVEARAGMSYAAMLSGIALANAGLGVVHGFASSIGGLYEIPHGVICGTLIGAANKMNINKLLKDNSDPRLVNKYAQIGRLFQKERNKSDYYYIMALANSIEAWIEELEIPRLSKYGVTADAFDKIIQATALKNNPVHLDKNELAYILFNRL